MKVKEIFSIILMLFLTIILTLFIFLFAFFLNLNMKSIENIINSLELYKYSENQASKVLYRYFPDEKANIVLQNISPSDELNTIIRGAKEGELSLACDNIKNEVKKELLEVTLNKDSDDSKIFVNNVTEEYMKYSFPINEISIFTTVYYRYEAYVKIILIILLILCLGIYILLKYNRKTYKYFFIGVYNAIIFSCMILGVLFSINNINLGNLFSNSLINELIKRICCSLIIEIIAIILIIFVLNYKAYFRGYKKGVRDEKN